MSTSTGRPPEYCAGGGHARVRAWQERRLAAEQAGTTLNPAEDGSPLITAKMTGAELLRSLRAEVSPTARGRCGAAFERVQVVGPTR
jgi:hypothetical protein